MEANVVIGLCALYGVVMHFTVRRVLSRLRDHDIDYFRFLGADRGNAISKSMAGLRMLLDDSVPKACYPESFKKQFKRARALFYLTPLVFVAIVVGVIVLA